MAGVTNRGKYRLLRGYFPNQSVPTNFYLALVTAAVAPGPDINTFGELTQIATGNGYATGGLSIARNLTDFDVTTEDDTNDRALVQLKDMVWTAAGGPIPASGAGARYAALTDDNVTVGSRDLIAHYDLAADRTVSDGQSLTLQDIEIRLTD